MLHQSGHRDWQQGGSEPPEDSGEEFDVGVPGVD